MTCKNGEIGVKTVENGAKMGSPMEIAQFGPTSARRHWTRGVWRFQNFGPSDCETSNRFAVAARGADRNRAP